MSFRPPKKPVLTLDAALVQDDLPLEVVSKIFVGSIHSAFNSECLHHHGITHILNASRLPVTFPKQFTYLSVEIRDRDASNILACIPTTNIFIEAGVENGGVLVHCFGGKSRSPAFIAAYIMSSCQWSFDQTYSVIKAARPIIEINPGFECQLRAYAAANYDVYIAQQLLLRTRIRELHLMRCKVKHISSNANNVTAMDSNEKVSDDTVILKTADSKVSTVGPSLLANSFTGLSNYNELVTGNNRRILYENAADAVIINENSPNKCQHLTYEDQQHDLLSYQQQLHSTGHKRSFSDAKPYASLLDVLLTAAVAEGNSPNFTTMEVDDESTMNTTADCMDRNANNCMESCIESNPTTTAAALSAAVAAAVVVGNGDEVVATTDAVEETTIQAIARLAAIRSISTSAENSSANRNVEWNLENNDNCCSAATFDDYARNNNTMQITSMAKQTDVTDSAGGAAAVSMSLEEFVTLQDCITSSTKSISDLDCSSSSRRQGEGRGSVEEENNNVATNKTTERTPIDYSTNLTATTTALPQHIESRIAVSSYSSNSDHKNNQYSISEIIMPQKQDTILTGVTTSTNEIFIEASSNSYRRGKEEGRNNIMRVADGIYSGSSGGYDGDGSGNRTSRAAASHRHGNRYGSTRGRKGRSTTNSSNDNNYSAVGGGGGASNNGTGGSSINATSSSDIDTAMPTCRLSKPGSPWVRVLPPLRGLEREFKCSLCNTALFTLANVLRPDIDISHLMEKLNVKSLPTTLPYHANAAVLQSKELFASNSRFSSIATTTPINASLRPPVLLPPMHYLNNVSAAAACNSSSVVSHCREENGEAQLQLSSRDSSSNRYIASTEDSSSCSAAIIDESGGGHNRFTLTKNRRSNSCDIVNPALNSLPTEVPIAMEVNNNNLSSMRQLLKEDGNNSNKSRNGSVIMRSSPSIQLCDDNDDLIERQRSDYGFTAAIITSINNSNSSRDLASSNSETTAKNSNNACSKSSDIFNNKTGGRPLLPHTLEGGGDDNDKRIMFGGVQRANSAGSNLYNSSIGLGGTVVPSLFSSPFLPTNATTATNNNSLSSFIHSTGSGGGGGGVLLPPIVKSPNNSNNSVLSNFGRYSPRPQHDAMVVDDDDGDGDDRARGSNNNNSSSGSTSSSTIVNSNDPTVISPRLHYHYISGEVGATDGKRLTAPLPPKTCKASNLLPSSTSSTSYHSSSAIKGFDFDFTDAQLQHISSNNNVFNSSSGLSASNSSKSIEDNNDRSSNDFLTRSESTMSSNTFIQNINNNCPDSSYRGSFSAPIMLAHNVECSRQNSLRGDGRLHSTSIDYSNGSGGGGGDNYNKSNSPGSNNINNRSPPSPVIKQSGTRPSLIVDANVLTNTQNGNNSLISVRSSSYKAQQLPQLQHKSGNNTTACIPTNYNSKNNNNVESNENHFNSLDINNVNHNITNNNNNNIPIITTEESLSSSRIHQQEVMQQQHQQEGDSWSPRFRPQSSEKRRWLARMNLIRGNDPQVVVAAAVVAGKEVDITRLSSSSKFIVEDNGKSITNDCTSGAAVNSNKEHFKVAQLAHDDDAASRLALGENRDKYFHIEYMDWMGREVFDIDKDRGDICCAGCRKTLGTWMWTNSNPSLFIDGKLEAPFFKINKNAVHQMEVRFDSTPRGGNTPRPDDDDDVLIENGDEKKT